MIYSYKNKTPRIAPGVFVAPDAWVIGDVSIGAGSGIWFGSLVRGDVHSIEIGENVNIQDHCVLHVTGGRFPLLIESNSTLAHRVTVHGCTLREHSFLGIGSIALDGSEIGEFGMLAAGSLLPPGKKIPPGKLAMGVPARVLRDITPEEEEMMRRIPEKYRILKDEYMDPSVFSPAPSDPGGI